MPRFLPAFCLSLSVLLVGLLGACKGESQCSNSKQCADGFVCNQETSACQAAQAAADASTVASTDATPACPGETHFCAAPAPEGWSGPVAGTQALAGETLASCPDSYPTEEKLVFSELVESGACNCKCPGAAKDVACDNGFIGKAAGSGFTCLQGISVGCFNIGDPPCTLSLPPNSSCIGTQSNNTLKDVSTIRVFLGKIKASGSCSDAVQSDDLDAKFASEERHCGAEASPASCPAEGLCLPSAGDSDFASLCIFQSGDLECPAEYPDKRLRFEGIADDRSCSDCSCHGPAIGTSCGGAVSLGCNAPNIFTDSCTAHTPGQAITARYTPNEKNMPCSAVGAELLGAATPTDPTTFCCLAAE